MKCIVCCLVLLLCTYVSMANSAVTDDWRTNCQIVNDYSTKLEFNVKIQEPRSTGTNKKQLLNLFTKFKLDSAPQLRKKSENIIGMINKAKPFKTSYGDADITISKELDKKIKELFDDINTHAKKSSVDCGSIGGTTAEPSVDGQQ